MSEYYIYDPYNLINPLHFEENHEIIKNPFILYHKNNVEVLFRQSNHTTSGYIVPYANIRTCRKGMTNPKGIICFLNDITINYINNVLIYLLKDIEKKIPILIHVKHITTDSILFDLPKSYKDKIESIFINYETKLNELYIKIPHNSHELFTFPLLCIVADGNSEDESTDESTDEYSSSDPKESDEDESDEDESDKIAIYNIDDINHESLKDIIIQDNNYIYMIGDGSKIAYKIDKTNECCEDTKSLVVLFQEYTEPKSDSPVSVNLVSIARKFKNLEKFILCYGKFLPECNLLFHDDELLNIKSLHIMGDGTNLGKITILGLQNLKNIDIDIVNGEGLIGKFINLPKLNKDIRWSNKLTWIEIIN